MGQHLRGRAWSVACHIGLGCRGLHPTEEKGVSGKML